MKNTLGYNNADSTTPSDAPTDINAAPKDADGPTTYADAAAAPPSNPIVTTTTAAAKPSN